MIPKDNSAMAKLKREREREKEIETTGFSGENLVVLLR
jgi:hypothetical protein